MWIKIIVLCLTVTLVLTADEHRPKRKSKEDTRGKRNLEYSISHTYPQTNYRLERRISTIPAASQRYPSFFPSVSGRQYSTSPQFIRNGRPNSYPPHPYAVSMEPLVHYSQRDPLYDPSSALHVLPPPHNELVKPEDLLTDNNHLSENIYGPVKHYIDRPVYIKEPEPIIEIIIKESNTTLPPPPQVLIPQKKKKEEVQVFYVKYKKNPHGNGKDSVIYDKPIPAISPLKDDSHEEEEQSYQEHPQEVVTYAPPRTTTIRAIIKPDSETFHADHGIHVTFNSEHNHHTQNSHEDHYSRANDDINEESAPQPALSHPHQGREFGFDTHLQKRQQVPSFPNFRQPQPYRPFTQSPPQQQQHTNPPPPIFNQQSFSQSFQSNKKPSTSFNPNLQSGPFAEPPRQAVPYQPFEQVRQSPPVFQFPKQQTHFPVHSQVPSSNPPVIFNPQRQQHFAQAPPHQNAPPQFHNQNKPIVQSLPKPVQQSNNFHTQQQNSFVNTQQHQQQQRPPPTSSFPNNGQSIRPVQPQQQFTFQQSQQVPSRSPSQFQQSQNQNQNQNFQYFKQHHEIRQQAQQQNQQNQPIQPIQHHNVNQQQSNNQFNIQNQQNIQSQQNIQQSIHQNQQQQQQQKQNQAYNQNQQNLQNQQHLQSIQQTAQHIIPPGGELIQSLPKFEQHISIPAAPIHHPDNHPHTSQQQLSHDQYNQQVLDQFRQFSNTNGEQSQAQALNAQHPQQPQQSIQISTNQQQTQNFAKHSASGTFQNQPSQLVNTATYKNTANPTYYTQQTTPYTTPKRVIYQATTTTTTQKPTTTTTQKAETTTFDLKSLNIQLPDEVPDDLRQQLLSSGILNNAQISVLDYDKVGDIPLSALPPDQLANFYSAGGGSQIAAGSEVQQQIVRPDGTRVNVPKQVDEEDDQTPEGSSVDEVIRQPTLKVVHYDPDTQKNVQDSYVKEGATQVEPVVLNDHTYNRYLPLKVSGTQFPIPDVPQLKGKNINSVVVLAPIDYNFQESPRITRDAKNTDIKFLKNEALKKLLENPSRENYREWLKRENSTVSEKQSVILLVTGSPDKPQTADREIFMYDVATQTVSKLNGELSNAFVDAAETNTTPDNTKKATKSSDKPESTAYHTAESNRIETRVPRPAGSGAVGILDRQDLDMDLAAAGSDLVESRVPIIDPMMDGESDDDADLDAEGSEQLERFVDVSGDDLTASASSNDNDLEQGENRRQVYISAGYSKTGYNSPLF